MLGKPKKAKIVTGHYTHAMRIYDAVHAPGKPFVYGVSASGRIKLEPAPAGAANKRAWMNDVIAELGRGVLYFQYDGLLNAAFGPEQLAGLVGCELVFPDVEDLCFGYAAPNKQCGRGIVKTKNGFLYYAEELLHLKTLFRVPGASRLYPCWNTVPRSIPIT